MAGLEDLRHAAFAKPFQQDIGTQDQLLTLALEDLVQLVGSHPAALDQLAGQSARLGKAGREAARQLVLLRRPQQAVTGNLIHQACNRINGHVEQSAFRRCRSCAHSLGGLVDPLDANLAGSTVVEHQFERFFQFHILSGRKAEEAAPAFDTVAADVHLEPALDFIDDDLSVSHQSAVKGLHGCLAAE